jgi:hypothetical protein
MKWRTINIQLKRILMQWCWLACKSTGGKAYWHLLPPFQIDRLTLLVFRRVLVCGYIRIWTKLSINLKRRSTNDDPLPSWAVHCSSIEFFFLPLTSMNERLSLVHSPLASGYILLHLEWRWWSPASAKQEDPRSEMNHTVTDMLGTHGQSIPLYPSLFNLIWSSLTSWLLMGEQSNLSTATA